MINNLPFETLHCHTTTSDGLLTHEQVLDECAKNKIGIVAFTDHDSVLKPETFQALKNLHHQVKFVTGIEISANTVAEVPGQISLFHITGLFIDPTNKDLVEYCKIAKAKRIERAERMLKNIQNLGFDVTMEEINSYAGGEVIGRPHIAKAILAKESNIKIIDDILDKLRVDSQKDLSLTELYNHAVNSDYWQKIFDLFLDDRSYLKGIYVHYLNPVSMDEAVTLIRNAGGLAQLAHWSYYKKKVTAELVAKFCQEKRLDGLETVYAFANEKYPTPQDFVGDMEYLTSLCTKHGLIQGGGGDFHKAEDFAAMIDPQNSRLANRTKGMTEKILTVNPNLGLI